VQKNKNLLEKKIGTNNFFLQEKDILNLLECFPKKKLLERESVKKKRICWWIKIRV